MNESPDSPVATNSLPAANSERKQSRAKVFFWIIAGLLLLVAACLRAYQSDSQCLWFDEIWHAELSNGRGSAHLRLPPDLLLTQVPNLLSLPDSPSIFQIWRNMDWVLHPPLFHAIFRIWRDTFGDSVSSWRAISATFSMASLAAIFYIGRKYFGLTAAVWAMAIAAISATQIAQARDTRGYTMAMLIGLITSLTLLSLQKRDRPSLRHTIAIGIGCMALLFTHYFAAGIVLALVGFTALQLRGRSRWQTLASIGIALLSFGMFWGPTLHEQLDWVHETADLFLKDQSGDHIAQTLLRLGQLPAILLADVTEPSTIVSAALLLIGLSIWAACAFAAWRNVTARLFFMQLIITAGMLALLDLLRTTRHLMFVRYALTASPAVYLCLASFMAHQVRSPRTIAAIPAAAALWCIMTLPYGYVQTLDYRPLATFLQANVARDEPLIFVSELPGRDGQTIYLYLAAYTHLFPHDMIIATHPIDRDNLAKFNTRSAWVISATPQINPRLVIPDSELERVVRFDQNGGIGACFHVRF